MPTVRDIEQTLYDLAPKELAQDWDNVGLLIGKPDREVHKVLVALDVTETTAAEAWWTGAELIVAHHPVMNCSWHPVQTIRDDDPQGRLFYRLIEGGTAAICMHTNLDAAEGGANDALAARLGLRKAEKIPNTDGIARMGELPEPMTLPAFLAWVRGALRPNGIRFTDSGRLIRRVAVGGGACGEYLTAAAVNGCDAFVTADLKYNHFLDAQSLGLTLLDAGHFPTEDVICPVLAEYLREKFPGLHVEKSASHREAVQYYV